MQVVWSAQPNENTTSTATTVPKNADVTKVTDDASLTEAEVLSGHSYHGEFLNEGPRQAAVLMDGTGAVDFAITTSDPKAQEFFTQGLGQYYGFWYLEAERSFRQAASIDPKCAMALWGAALSTVKEKDRARGFIEAASELKSGVTKRERMYIESLAKFLKDESEGADDDDDGDGARKLTAEEKKAAEQEKKEKEKEKREKRLRDYTSDLEAIAIEFPDDIEAKALLALRLYENKRDLPNPSYLAVDGLLDKVFAAQPMHSSHHFRIHLWDHKKPENALQSAALCGPASPAIAHMWHMPGHIYSRLKRYGDACWQQEASARVDHAHMIRAGLMPDQIHNFAHNNEWLIRNLNFVGRSNDAIDLAQNMISLPRHPKFNTLKKRGSASYGRDRLIGTLFRYERWYDAIEFCEGGVIEPTDDFDDQVERLCLLGVAAYSTGNQELGGSVMKDLRDQLSNKRDTQKKAGNKAAAAVAEPAAKPAVKPKEGEAKTESAKTRSGPSDEKSGEPNVDKAVKSDDSKQKDLAHFTAKQKSTREREHRRKQNAARIKARKKFATPINTLFKAAAQVEAARLRLEGKHKESLEQLKKAEGEFDRIFLATAHQRAGEFDRALEIVRKEIDKRKNEVLPYAALVEIQWAAGNQKETQNAFDKLRDLAVALDKDSGVYRRIAQIAGELDPKYRRADWRSSPKVADDIGQRPELSSLGPFRWRPRPAPTWTLPSTEGKTRSLEDYRGKPVIVIFYLGHGCLHCAEQLHKFAPMAAKFRAVGIDLVAVSSDEVDGLTQSLVDFGKSEMPIPLVSDSKHDVFKAYRAYDDFESQPLHGTYLIDGDGRIRWQDTGFEPFMEAGFLLDESVRLLKQPMPSVQ